MKTDRNGKAKQNMKLLSASRFRLNNGSLEVWKRRLNLYSFMVV